MNPSYLGARLTISLAIGISATKRNSIMSIYKTILDFCSKKILKFIVVLTKFLLMSLLII